MSHLTGALTAGYMQKCRADHLLKTETHSSTFRHWRRMAAKPILQGKQISWQDLCSQVLGPFVSNVKAQRIGSLWGKYGSVTRLVADVDGTAHTLVAKQVDPPAGAGAGHERKIKSYAVEAAFYQHYCPHLLSAGVCDVSRPLRLDVSPPQHFFFLLSDLSFKFPQQLHSYTQQEAEVALDWLAAFHAFWWEQVPGQDQPVSHSAALPMATAAAPTGLWDQGCYWHLDTRQEEFRNMSSSWKDLKAVAARVDQVLKGYKLDGSKTTAHRTLVHGDFKSENVLFDQDSQRCAAYDFQYTGEGLGVRDVAYMLASSLDEDTVVDCEQQLLQHYHSKLLTGLRRHDKGVVAGSYSLEVMTAQYELCLLDYMRFMAGWGMWGNAAWATSRCKDIMGRLEQVMTVARTGW